MRVTVNITDVRWASDWSDYTGELRAILQLRITDQSNGPTLADAATMSDTPYGVTVPCAATPSAAIGVDVLRHVTTADAVAPGTVLEGRRAMWQIGQVEVTDGGADGVGLDRAQHHVHAAGRVRPVGPRGAGESRPRVA